MQLNLPSESYICIKKYIEYVYYLRVLHLQALFFTRNTLVAKK